MHGLVDRALELEGAQVLPTKTRPHEVEAMDRAVLARGAGWAVEVLDPVVRPALGAAVELARLAVVDPPEGVVDVAPGGWYIAFRGVSAAPISNLDGPAKGADEGAAA